MIREFKVPLPTMELQLEIAKQKAMKDLQAEVSKLVLSVAEKVLRETVDPKKAETLTTKALKDLH
jgi:F0F1-type ATP synthase membrane subunit b/b'